jgi:hypothetical protein
VPAPVAAGLLASVSDALLPHAADISSQAKGRAQRAIGATFECRIECIIGTHGYRMSTCAQMFAAGQFLPARGHVA